MIPILHRGHALQSFLDPLGVVPLDVLIDSPGEILDGGEVLSVIHLGFQMPEEVLHHRVVITVALARHRRHRLVVLQQTTPGGVLVLEALVGVDQEPVPRIMGAQRVVQTGR